MHPALPIIARIARVEAESLRPDTTLAALGLNSSLGLGILQSALERRFQRRLGPFTWETSVAGVLAALGEGTAAPVSTAPADPAAAPPPVCAAPSGPFGGRTRSPTGPAAPALGHGVDIQEIAAMPEPSGERAADPFYASHFTAAELAGAAKRADARTHLCGLWCAKEAVRKSDPALAGLAYCEIAIEHDAAGRPLVRLAHGSNAFSISLSISHSAAYAMASAITVRV